MIDAADIPQPCLIVVEEKAPKTLLEYLRGDLDFESVVIVYCTRDREKIETRAKRIEKAIRKELK